MIPNSSEGPPYPELAAGEALLFFFALVPVVLVGGTLLQKWNLTLGTILMEWGLIFAPTLLYVRVRRKRTKKILRARIPSPGHLLASIVMCVGLVPLVAELAMLQDLVIPIPEDLLEAMKEAFTVKEGESLFLSFIAFSITPAICEEVLFRGFLLTGLLSRLDQRGAATLTGILFGLFHLNVYRFLPTAVIGIVLGFVVLRSGSLFTGIVFHALNNAIALAAVNISWLARYPWLLEERHIPLPVLLVSSLLFAGGLTLLRAGRKETAPAGPEHRPPQSPESGGRS
jgi:membrane protease YdiL (CAAX protease family)